MSFLLFGLTGGVASGKSTVAKRFRAAHVPVIDADALAREVVAPGSAGLAAVVDVFGRDVLRPDGSLDRSKLAAMVFGDAGRRGALGAIVHPRIAALSSKRAQELRESGHELACYEAALLVENGLVDAFRPLVVVSLPPALQIDRAMRRDGWTEEQVRERIKAQSPLSEKIAQADYVVDNSGSLADTEHQADAILASIREYAAKRWCPVPEIR